MLTFWQRAAVVLLLAVAWASMAQWNARANWLVFSGWVQSRNRAVPGATVRLKATPFAAITDSQGRFQLRVPKEQLQGDATGRLTASADGYLIAGVDAAPHRLAQIPLVPHTAVDWPDYAWVDPRPDPTAAHRCGNCHPEIYSQWSTSTHAQSATNPRLWDLIEGTARDRQHQAGPSIRSEYPGAESVCLACHVASEVPRLAGVERPQGVDALGIHCDLCHKVADVDPGTTQGLNFGRFALELLRPATGQLFFGPLDDVDRGEDSYRPLYQQSRYCASCHEGLIFGFPAYTTYSEWQQSPAARQGQQCQDCHQAPHPSSAGNRLTNIAPGQGGWERDPESLSSHDMPGRQPEFVRRCLELKLEVRTASDRLVVVTHLTARRVGHRVPTGNQDRALIVRVLAVDAQGRRLEQRQGPVLPPLAGIVPQHESGIAAPANPLPARDPPATAIHSIDELLREKHLAGQPGQIYAKQLPGTADATSGMVWQHAELAADTRLWPEQTDRQEYAFAGPELVQRVIVELRYRRAPQWLADVKGWPDNEYLVHRVQWTPASGPAAAVTGQ